jgi:hypothetical protein
VVSGVAWLCLFPALTVSLWLAETLLYLLSQLVIVDFKAECQQCIQHMPTGDGLVKCLGQCDGFVGEELMLFSGQGISPALRGFGHGNFL